MRLLLKHHWPMYKVKNPKIGVLKLVPKVGIYILPFKFNFFLLLYKTCCLIIEYISLKLKVHKLTESINEHSWFKLKSRPIRGAEQDPMGIPSKALYSLLKMLLTKFSLTFPSLYSSHQSKLFPVLSGCDDYLERLREVEIDYSNYGKLFLISADFEDAFTKTDIASLKESISVIGTIVGSDNYEIELIIRLVDLVFSNCYFYTPSGLYRQTKVYKFRLILHFNMIL